mgnify:CR=1 FL=1
MTAKKAFGLTAPKKIGTKVKNPALHLQTPRPVKLKTPKIGTGVAKLRIRAPKV